MYLTRQMLGIQLIEIGNAFGGRDHSTVIHSIDKITNALTTDTGFKTRVDKTRSMLERIQH
jgi:chromosomal replication initiator protein